MTIEKRYYLHSRGGSLGMQGTSALQDLDAIVADLKASSAKHLILHFHGGLVSQASGFTIAANLLNTYLPGGHPLFFIWEAGAWEAIRNNITELADEPLFKQLVRKLLQYALGRLGATNGARSIAPNDVDPRLVKETLENFIQDPKPDTIPYKDFVPVESEAKARSAADSVNVGEIQADLERDAEFKRALASLPDIPAGQRSTLQLPETVIERRTLFAEVASEKLSDSPNRRGLITFFKAAWLIKNILVAVLRRYGDKRDHGLYATIVEEIVREFKVGGSGLNQWGQALQWNRMKQDCDDAFGDGPARVGSALLARLRDEFDQGRGIKRITLIGHSTGAIYICAFLKAADAVVDSTVQFDVVFLAPAVTYERFAETLRDYGRRIRSFRMFAMSDELERNDQVWGSDPALGDVRDWRRFIYPSSLLYLVSGMLETRPDTNGARVQEADVPLLGMQRYFSTPTVYGTEKFAEVDEVRIWLQAHTDAFVWSPSENMGDGLNSICNDHGSFDNEKQTVASLAHIVTGGF